MPRTRKRSEHYVNNKEFLAAIIEYKEKVALAETRGEPKPRITNYLGECFLKIATHLSYKPNFVNYMFKDDMICDGIENCVQYINNFNPEKSSNPFAYFTQIIHYAFLRRIQKEKKQLEIKTKILERSGYDLSLIHISEPTRQEAISYAVFCLKKIKYRKTLHLSLIHI